MMQLRSCSSSQRTWVVKTSLMISVYDVRRMAAINMAYLDGKCRKTVISLRPTVLAISRIVTGLYPFFVINAMATSSIRSDVSFFTLMALLPNVSEYN